MLFGLQASPQLEATQIANAHGRLQRKMEDDPAMTSMQPGGVTVLPTAAAPTAATPPGVAQPAAAFTWGQGGARMSPDELEYRRKVSDQQIAAGMDFSPVQSWTQGMARVAQALIGGQERRKLDRASTANTDARSAILRELTKATPNPNAVTAAVSDADPAIREFGGKVWSMQHPKPQGPSELQQRIEYLNTFKPGLGGEYASNYAANGGMAPQVVTTPQGTFMVPRSSSQSAAPVPSGGGIPDAALSFLQQNPGSAAQFDAKYGTGASSRYLQGGAAPQAQAPFQTR